MYCLYLFNSIGFVTFKNVESAECALAAPEESDF